MQSSKEQQEEIRMPSSVINAKKQRKRTEWEGLEISSEKVMAPHSSTLAWKTPWMEVRDIVQETGIKIVPMENKCKKVKWLSGEALQRVVKRREIKQRRKGKT